MLLAQLSGYVMQKCSYWYVSMIYHLYPSCSPPYSIRLSVVIIINHQHIRPDEIRQGLLSFNPIIVRFKLSPSQFYPSTLNTFNPIIVRFKLMMGLLRCRFVPSFNPIIVRFKPPSIHAHFSQIFIIYVGLPPMMHDIYKC